MKLPILVITGSILLSGCISTAGGLGGRVSSPNVRNEAIALSQTHRDVTTGIILSAILESRDRGTSNLTTMSGISSTPTVSTTAGLKFSPLGLGNAVGPFKGSDATLNQMRKSGVSYTINPFSGEDGEVSSGSLRPVPSAVFENYWNSGWPPEVLLLLMVDRVVVHHTDNSSDTIHNNNKDPKKFLTSVKSKLNEGGGGLRGLKVDKTVTVASECQSLSNTELRRLLSVNYAGAKDYVEGLKALSDLIEGDVKVLADKKTKEMRPHICSRAKSALALVKREKKVADISHITFELRSLDSMIYHVGEMMRLEGSESNIVSGPDCTFIDSQNDKSVIVSKQIPLLKVTKRPKEKADYAVSTIHRGVRYYAVKRTEKLNECPVDRGQTVMMILSQVYQLTQSKEFLKAPSDQFIRQ